MAKEQNKICGVCGKDHSKPNEGLLTVCELAGYLREGGLSNSKVSGKRYHTFGSGNRYQIS